MTWHKLHGQQKWLYGKYSELWLTHMHVHKCSSCTGRNTRRTALGRFGVQRMFYFGNSFGLVTLHWWQTEEQVANIKHFTSTPTCTNTHSLAHKHRLVPTSPISSWFHKTTCRRENALFKNVQTDFFITSSWSVITALLTALSKTQRSCVVASLTHNATGQDAGMTEDKSQYCEVVILAGTLHGAWEWIWNRKQNRFPLEGSLLNNNFAYFLFIWRNFHRTLPNAFIQSSRSRPPWSLRGVSAS